MTSDAALMREGEGLLRRSRLEKPEQTWRCRSLALTEADVFGLQSYYSDSNAGAKHAAPNKRVLFGSLDVSRSGDVAVLGTNTNNDRHRTVLDTVQRA